MLRLGLFPLVFTFHNCFQAADCFNIFGFEELVDVNHEDSFGQQVVDVAGELYRLFIVDMEPIYGHLKKSCIYLCYLSFVVVQHVLFQVK